MVLLLLLVQGLHFRKLCSSQLWSLYPLQGQAWGANKGEEGQGAWGGL